MRALSEYDKAAVDIAGTAFNKVLKFHRDREVIGPKQGVLHHYTTADGLKGIVENSELWASSAYFLNDSAEITYGYGLLKEALDKWLTQNPRSEESVSLGLARVLRRWFGEDLLNKNVIQPIYLACFCEDDNLLSQWRAYGQSGGYSVGFRVPPDRFTNQGFKPEPNTYTSKWVKVEYDRNEQIRKCDATLGTLLAIFDDENTAQAIANIGDHPIVGYTKCMRAIVDILLEEIVSFKNEAFNIEKEWRVVVRPRELTKQGTDDGGKTPMPLYFRSSRGMLVPYVKLVPIDSAKGLPLACVRSGPTLDKATAGMAVSLMLGKKGISIPVRGSDITVRL
jgi:hypothetical protein